MGKSPPPCNLLDPPIYICQAPEKKNINTKILFTFMSKLILFSIPYKDSNSWSRILLLRYKGYLMYIFNMLQRKYMYLKRKFRETGIKERRNYLET